MKLKEFVCTTWDTIALLLLLLFFFAEFAVLWALEGLRSLVSWACGRSAH